MTSVARVAYRTLLRLAPRDLRAKHGPEMEALFVADLAAARALGRRAALGVCLAAVADVARRAPYEHWRRRGRPSARGRHEPLLTSFAADLRYAARSLRRQPGAAALIVGTLALAVAANVAVFAMVDAVFFRALPYANAARLVDLNEQAPTWGLDFTGINYADFVAWRTTARTFEAMALWDDAGFNLADDHGSERVSGQHVTFDMVRTLGIAPILGRSFTQAEDVPNGPNVVMIGYGLWQNRFGGARDVVGKTIRIGSAPYTIIGVLPANVTLDGPATLWLPVDENPNQEGESYSYEGVGRLKPGVTLAQARADLAVAQAPIWQRSDTSHTVSPRVMPLRDRFVADYRPMGAALGAGVVLVLLIACANVAGAMLARSVARRREMGIRVALGASHSRLMRQLLTESLVLAVAGGVIGTVVGRMGIGLLTAGVESPPPWLHLTMDTRAVAFSLLIVLVTTVLFGLAPSMSARRMGAAGATMEGGSRTAGSVPERRMLDGLVVAEVALAAVLLSCGGLLVRAYLSLRDVDPGFRPDGVASVRVSLPMATYPTWVTQGRFFEAVVAGVAAIPGVTDAGAVTCPPFGCHEGRFYAAEGAVPKRPGASDQVVLTRRATPGYFAAMGITLMHGRYYSAHEGSPTGFHPAVINATLAAQLWPDGSNPVGKRFVFRGDTTARDRMTVVGVVKDVRHYGLARPMTGGLYLPLTTMDSTSSRAQFTIVAHTAGRPEALFASMRAVVRGLDPELPVFAVQTMRTALDHSLAARRAIALWLAAFAGIALCLAIGGIYAVLSYVVGRRRREIGIRMALGARSPQVLGLVVRQGSVLMAIGLVIGLPAALVAARLLSSQLGGVSARDPLTYAGVVIVLCGTGAIAAWIPARRAARVDPTIVLSDAT
ncbi:MAG TPA: ABC transporter permease [Gemmatimonadaceae bacterium]|nr:ABC transporter permease [Gemmatimonadaceae bacterium]